MLKQKIIGLKAVLGEIQDRDFIKLNGLIALLQNFSNIEETIELSKPINFGLVNSINMARIELQINY
jgi:threonine synthase